MLFKPIILFGLITTKTTTLTMMTESKKRKFVILDDDNSEDEGLGRKTKLEMPPPKMKTKKQKNTNSLIVKKRDWDLYREVAGQISNHSNVELIYENIAESLVQRKEDYLYAKEHLTMELLGEMIQHFPLYLKSFEDEEWKCPECGCGPDEECGGKNCQLQEACDVCTCGGCGCKKTYYDDCHC